MIEIGDAAPDVTVPLAGGSAYNDVSRFTLSEAVDDGPTVLAFVPGAFTDGCTTELGTFDDHLDEFEGHGATVYGVSVDLPFAQNVWLQREGWDLSLLSDWDHTMIERYDVVFDGMYELVQAAERSVFVIDETGHVSYRWVRDGNNPDFDELVDEVLESLE